MFGCTQRHHLLIPSFHVIFIRVKVVTVHVVMLLIARHVRRPVFARLPSRAGSNLAKLPGPVDMRQAAVLTMADTFVSIVGTLMNVTFGAECALYAEAKSRKGAADWRGWIGPDMGVAAVRLRAVASDEV